MDPEFNLNVSGLRVTSTRESFRLIVISRRKIVKRVKSRIPIFLITPRVLGIRRTEKYYLIPGVEITSQFRDERRYEEGFLSCDTIAMLIYDQVTQPTDELCGDDICPYSVNFQRQIETNYGFSDPSGCELETTLSRNSLRIFS